MANANAAASRTADASRPRARATFQDFQVLIDQERYRYGGKPGRSRSPCFRAQASCRRSAPRSRTEAAARRGLLRATRGLLLPEQSESELPGHSPIFGRTARRYGSRSRECCRKSGRKRVSCREGYPTEVSTCRRTRRPNAYRQASQSKGMVGFWVICSFCPWSGPYRGDAAGPVGSCLPSLSALNSRRLWRSARIARQRPCGR